MNIRNLARKALAGTARVILTVDKKLEPSDGQKLRELIDDESIPTAAKFEALETIQQNLKALQETDNA